MKMECTQLLECTQEHGTQSERVCPEQIGFLGICGKKYPVKKGPNKIGRDPQTCNIILNLNSVSRQHAVINVLNKKDFMLMDLDSANKTKLCGKSLQPYIPNPLHNGDTVQFGEIFGIFRLLEEDDDLPMTQALDIPDTPIPTKHLSRINAVTTIPESPDVSDKDDSFIVPSQTKEQYSSCKPRNFIKPGRTISIQPIGTNKIDNIFWNSSKKSTSLNLDDSNCNLNNSLPCLKLDDKENEVLNNNRLSKTQEVYSLQKRHDDSTDSLYTANTQLPELDSAGSIHTANTQLPDATRSPSIHSMNTQMPCGISPSIHTLDTPQPSGLSPSIHTLDTQIPNDFLPKVRKINEQEDMQFDLCIDKNIGIHNAETQMFPSEKVNVPVIADSINDSNSNIKPDPKLDESNEEVLFDEVDDQIIEGLESQALLTEDIDLPINKFVEPEVDSQSQMSKPKGAKRNMRIKSDSSNDCDDFDILPTQKILQNNADDDTTDCEEEMIELKPDKNKANVSIPCVAVDNFEDMPTQVLIEAPSNDKRDVDFEDMPTQVLIEAPSNVKRDVDFEDMPTQVLIEAPSNDKRDVDFEDMPTQVIDVNDDAKIENDTSNNDLDFEDLPTQILIEDIPSKKKYNAPQLSYLEENSPFKVPFNSPLKAKKKDIVKTPKIKPISITSKPIPNNEDIEKYYKDTQDIYDDLCTQKIDILEVKSEDKVDGKSPNTKNEKSNKLELDTSVIEVDSEEKVNEFVSNLSNTDIRDIIGVDTEVAQITKASSDGSTASDVDVTPKKVRSFRFLDMDLPNSQEIKTSVTLCTRSTVTESSSESDTENNSEDQCTPILFRKKKKPKSDAKVDLIKKFDVEALPSRVITRVRKPAAKLQDRECIKKTENILKPKFFTEQECDIDTEIITENISRLKSNNEKSKNTKSSNDVEKGSKLIEPIKEKSKVEGCKNEIYDRKVVSAKQLKLKDSHEDENEKKKESSALKLFEDSKDDAIRTNKEKDAHSSSIESKDNSRPNKSKDTKSLQVVVEIKRETESAKTECNNRNKNEELKDKSENRTGNTNNSSNNDNRRKREHKNTLNEVIESIKASKNKNKPNKSKEIEILDLTKSPIETKRSTRSTRNTKTKDKSTKTENKTSPLENSTEKPTKRKYTRKQANKTEVEKEPSPEKVRRSRRQKTMKEKQETEKAPKSILKKSVTTLSEESAVYNMSLSSNSDTSRTFKRPALDDSELPSPKRTRSVVANNNTSRSTPARLAKTQFVLFTAFPFEAVKVKLEKMGAVIVTDVTKSTVILTQQIKRTFKLLCAVGLGKPIVGPNWVQACADTNMIVDPWLYLIKDEAAEKRFHFSLQRTLTGKRNFLKGYNLSSTPSVMPAAYEMKLIVECSGGTWKEGGSQWICVSVPDDKPLWPALRNRGATIVSTEFILAGVLRQNVEIDATKFKI